MDSQAAVVRKFLDSIDIRDPDWKNKAESWIISYSEKRLAPRQRVARFSVGEDDCLDDLVNVPPFSCDISSSSVAGISTERVEMGIQCDLDAFLSEEDQLIRSTEDRLLDDLNMDLEAGRKVRPGDALRLLKYESAKHKHRDLEKKFGFDHETAIAVRRSFIDPKMQALRYLPFRNYDYELVKNTCCENVIGVMPVPVGVAGPLRLNFDNNSDSTYFPLATTEGALVASVNRGCSVILKAGGVQTKVYRDGMTRAPAVSFPTEQEVIELKVWLGERANFNQIKKEFESTSRFARLNEIEVYLDGREAHLRFVATTGDAMGMNMITKGCETAMKALNAEFPRMTLKTLSGNMCSDKKAAQINLTRGRGKSVLATCTIPADLVKTILKTTPAKMADVAHTKMQRGSSLAGCVGGNNAHAANIVAAMFIATGQDPAQVVSSSMCSTKMEITEGGDLHVSCDMPCLEVGTLGGGTILAPQKSLLQLMKCAGPAEIAGENSRRLAQIICAAVMAGELSLMAELCEHKIVGSHMRLNRSKLDLYPSSSPSLSTPTPLPTIGMKKEGAGRVKRNSERNPTIKVDCSNIL